MSDGVPVSGVVVVGNGTASAPPDLVRLDVAAESAANSVQDALDQATGGLARMRSALSNAGVEVADLRTTETTVHEDYGPRGEGPRRFVARLGLSAKLHDVATAGQTVQRVLAEGGDTARLNGLTFALSDPAGLSTTARDGAFGDALAKAQQYAELTGRALGAVVSVDETGSGGAVPLPRRAVEVPLAADFVVQGGQQEVTVKVTVHWSWA